MEQKLRNPPKWVQKVLSLVCHEDLFETVDGDLFELYQKHFRKYGSVVATVLYFFNMLQFMRPFAFNTPQFYRGLYQNYLRVILRNMKRNKGISAMNVIGMALAFVISSAIFAYIAHELSYDRYHPNGQRVYRVTYHFQNSKGYDIHWARMVQDWVNGMEDEFPEIDKLVRFQSFRTRDIHIGENNYRENFSYAVDPEVFELFDLEVLEGSKELSLRPYTVVLTATAAKKYFGEKEALNKTIEIKNDLGQKESYKVTAIIKDPPANTHLPIHLLTSINSERERKGWAYTYILLKEQAKISSIASKIENYVASHQELEAGEHLKVHFQPLQDIHLHSNLSREITANGSITNLMIFGLVGIFLLVVASVNFINLVMVRSMDKVKEFTLRKSLGAGKGEERIYVTLESFIFCFFSDALAAGVFYLGLDQFQEFLGHPLVFSHSALMLFLLICMLFISGLSAFMSTMPLKKLLKNPIPSSFAIGGSQRGDAMRLLLGLQFTTVLVLVACMITIQKQFNYMTNKDLGFDSDQVMVFGNNSRAVMRKYDLLKTELSKFPEVKGVSAVMEMPTVAIKDRGPVSLLDDPSKSVSADIQVIDINGSDLLEMEFVAGEGLPAYLVEKSDLPDSLVWKDFGTKPRGYIINESLAKELGLVHPKEAIGKKVNWSIGEVGLSYGPIAGVIKDFHQESLAEEIRPLIMTYEPVWLKNILIKTNTSDQFLWHDKLERFWKERFPEEPLQLSYLDQELNTVYESESRQLQLMTLFTSIAVFIAFMGLYVLIMYTIKRRLKELAIRRVLGARWINEVILLGKSYLTITMVSMLVAFPLIYWMMREWHAGYAYHIALNGSRFLLAGALLLLLLAVTLTYQVLNNAKRNPAVTLSTE